MNRFEDAPAVYAAILSLLLRKTRLEAVELTSYGRMTKGFKDILEQARYNLFTQGLKIPAKLGEGPDKNHSYHQNIEAGKRYVVFHLFYGRCPGTAERIGV